MNTRLEKEEAQEEIASPRRWEVDRRRREERERLERRKSMTTSQI